MPDCDDSVGQIRAAGCCCSSSQTAGGTGTSAAASVSGKAASHGGAAPAEPAASHALADRRAETAPQEPVPLFLLHTSLLL